MSWCLLFVNKLIQNNVKLFQDAPVSKYLLTVMAQLMMAAGQLDKLQKAGNDFVLHCHNYVVLQFDNSLHGRH